MQYSLNEPQDIGLDEGTPVDNTYKPSFRFTGKIEQFVVDLK